jgi:hypothetical protein
MQAFSGACAGIQIGGTDGGIHGPQVRCDLNASAPPPPAPPRPPPPPPGEHAATADAWFLIHYSTKESYTERATWKVHNATIKDFPTDFKFRGGAGVGLGTYTEGNWNPAPVALPDGRVRIMVHTGWSGKQTPRQHRAECSDLPSLPVSGRSLFRSRGFSESS